MGWKMKKISIVANACAVVILLSGLVMAENSAPKDWNIAGSKPEAYVIQVDPAQKSAYGKSVSLTSKGDANETTTATLMQAIKADDYRGKRVRFAGYIKGQGVKSWAGLWMRVNDAADKATILDNMEKRAFRGDGDWRKFEVVLDIPGDSAKISFGMLLVGQGRIWVSGLDFQIVDATVPVTAKSSVPELSRKPVNLELN